MKNITAVCAVLALFLAPSVSNARWGTEFTGSSWTMDGKEFMTSLKTYKAYSAANPGFGMTGEVTEGKLGGAASFFMEGNSRTRLGLAAGFGSMPAVSAKLNLTGSWSGNINIENKITYIPLDLYLKHVSEKGKFSLFGGGGADYIMAKTEYKANDTGGAAKGTFTQKKVMPHVQAGCELFLAKWISFNISAKYLFGAVLDKMTGKVTEAGVDKGENILIMTKDPVYGEYFGYKKTSIALASDERAFKYDLSGLRANVGLRIYFN